MECAWGASVMPDFTSKGGNRAPVLRLVRDGVASAHPLVAGDTLPPTPARVQAVAAENALASGITGGDARLIFASKVAGALEGGRAAILPPERRRALVAAGVEMGLRPFDANLVIAIVQDGTRSGEPISVSARERLALLGEPLPVRKQPSHLFLLFWSVLLGAAGVLALIRGVLGSSLKE